MGAEIDGADSGSTTTGDGNSGGSAARTDAGVPDAWALGNDGTTTATGAKGGGRSAAWDGADDGEIAPKRLDAIDTIGTTTGGAS